MNPEHSYTVGVWCGLPNLLAYVGLPGEKQVPLLQVTLLRTRGLHVPTRALVPWTPDFDALAADVKDWKYPLERCHPDERIAMRDLVAHWNAKIGVLVYGNAATIDDAEIRLEVARVQQGVGERVHKNSRLCVCPADVWLLPGDTEEWVAPMDVRELSLFYAGVKWDDMENVQARAIKARRDSRLPSQK